MDLADAMLADKFTWRPSADARSLAEVFLHLAGEPYGPVEAQGKPAEKKADQK